MVAEMQKLSPSPQSSEDQIMLSHRFYLPSSLLLPEMPTYRVNANLFIQKKPSLRVKPTFQNKQDEILKRGGKKQQGTSIISSFLAEWQAKSMYSSLPSSPFLSGNISFLSQSFHPYLFRPLFQILYFCIKTIECSLFFCILFFNITDGYSFSLCSCFYYILYYFSLPFHLFFSTLFISVFNFSSLIL